MRAGRASGTPVASLTTVTALARKWAIVRDAEVVSFALA
jgi:hypothetical protein